MVVVRVPGPSATAVDVTCGSIGAAGRAATVRWSGVDHDRALTGSTDARPDGRVSPAARAARDGAVLAGLLFLAYLFVVDRPRRSGTVGFDAFAYWNVDAADPVPGRRRRRSAPSTTRRRSRGSSARSGCSSGRSFLWIWMALLVGNLVWLGGRSVRVLWLLALPPVAFELYHGNVHLWIAVGDRARLPLPVDLGVRAADQGDARARPRLVRRPTGVALARDRARGDRRDRRGLAGARPPAVVRVDLVPLGDARGRVGRPVPDPGAALAAPAARGRASSCGAP